MQVIPTLQVLFAQKQKKDKETGKERKTGPPAAPFLAYFGQDG